MAILAIVAVGCAGSLGNAADGQQTRSATPSPDPGPQTAPPLDAAPSASFEITDPTPQLLAWHAYGFVVIVQRAERSLGNAELAPTVCPRAFSELELAAAWAQQYQANPALADFIVAAGSIDWSCDRRDTRAIRTGVRALSSLLPPLMALAAPQH